MSHRPTGEKWTLKNKDNLQFFNEWVQGEWIRGQVPVVSVMGEERTSSQNSAIYALYGEIARNTGEAVVEVKNMCKLHYGIPILRASDPEFCRFYDERIKKTFDYGGKLALMDHMSVTSDFTKAQATQYIDSIVTAYRERGIQLEKHKLE